jgi:chemotaxis protein CheD
MRAAHNAATNTVVVPLGELRVSADPTERLITYALGSCLGITVYDPVARVGGMLHAMLPRSEIDPVKAQQQPALFVETGIPALFRACYACGARKPRLLVRIAGAALVSCEGYDHFEIGKRNLLMARQLFWHNSVFVRGQDVGGNESRTMSLHVGSGEVVIRKRGGSVQL